MHASLTLHQDSNCTAITGIDVEAVRPGPCVLSLRYVVSGEIAGIRIPAALAPVRADGLWKHTCFEAFLRAGPGYYEFNFSPSTRWAAYGFNSYRAGMAEAEIAAPRIETLSEKGRLEVRAELTLESLPDLPRDSVWRLGLSAVIEDAGGGMSYWALAHPPGKPDFHHSDCFAADLPAAWRP